MEYDFEDRLEVFVSSINRRTVAFDADLRGTGPRAGVFLAQLPQ